jgi:hypothetical protein
MRKSPFVFVSALLAVGIIGPVASVASAADGPSVAIYFDRAAGPYPDGKVPASDPGCLISVADQELIIDYVKAWRDAGEPDLYLIGADDTEKDDLSSTWVSACRVIAVANALEAAGMPAEKYQGVALGEMEPEIETGDGVAEPLNRTVSVFPQPDE